MSTLENQKLIPSGGGQPQFEDYGQPMRDLCPSTGQRLNRLWQADSEMFVIAVILAFAAGIMSEFIMIMLACI